MSDYQRSFNEVFAALIRIRDDNRRPTHRFDGWLEGQCEIALKHLDVLGPAIHQYQVEVDASNGEHRNRRSGS